MKRLWIVGLIAFLAGHNRSLFADEVDGELAFGFSVDPQRGGASLHLYFRPEKLVYGVAVGNSVLRKTVEGNRATVKSADLTAVVGYWSNKEKTSKFGYHAYGGVGVSRYFTSGGAYGLRDTTVHAKAGAGLDWYLFRRPKNKYTIAFSAGGAFIVTPVRLQSNYYAAASRHWLTYGSPYLGLSFWF